MPHLPHNHGSDAAPTVTLTERCRALGVPCVRLDAATAGVATPDASAALRAWLASSEFVEQCRRFVESGAMAGALATLPGCLLVALHSAERGGRLLGVVLSEQALGGPAFESFMSASGLAPDAARDALEPWIQRGTHGVDRVVATLGWLRDDTCERIQSASLLDEFSARLLQVYEESHALFRMMRVTSSGGSAREQVQIVCNQIHEIFPFGWMCTMFKDDPVVEPRLRGQFIFAGKPPCEVDGFRHEVAAVLAGATSGASCVLDVGRSPLATLVDAEVICEPIAHDSAVIGVLLAGNKGGPDPRVASPEIKFLDAVTDFLGTFHENAMRFAEQRSMFLATVGALTATIDAKDPYTRGHSERVAYLTERIALAIGQTEEQAARARIAGMVHDIGKIGVPDAVLCKNGRLTDDEFAAIKRHPEIGYRILRDIEPLQDILPGVLHHHERWDGRGYPHSIAGENIELIARMIGLADAFDAMSSTRSYRAGLSRDHVLMELNKCSGTQFDPDLVRAFATIDLTPYDHMVNMQAPPTIIAAKAA